MQAGADDVLAKPPDAAEIERGLIAAERITTMHRRMRADARVDALTGAGSRSRLDEDLAAMCARVVRYGHAYCIAMVGLEPGSRDVLERAGRALVQRDPLRRRRLPLRRRPSSSCCCPSRRCDTANLAAARLRGAVESAVPATAPWSASAIVTTAGAEPEPDGAARARGGGAVALGRERRRRGLRVRRTAAARCG